MPPPLDLNGLVTAIVSAGLLTFAIVWVARSRRTMADLDTPLSQAFSRDSGLMSRELFSTVVENQGFPGLGLLASATLHAVLIFGTPLLPYLFPQELRVDLRKYQVRMVEFRVPQKLLYTAEDRERTQKRAPQPRVVAGGGAAARARKPAVAPAAPAVAAASARPRFQLPESFQSKSRDVLLQPDQPPEVTAALPQPLPRTFLWAQAPTPVAESRTVGSPALPPAPKIFALPQSQPALRLPNRDLAVGDVQIGTAPVLTFRPPQLPVPAANISPVSVPLPDPPALGELPATPLPPGSPINLVALMREVAASAPAYLMGVGNRLPEPGAPGTETPGGAEQGAGTVPGAAAGTHADLLTEGAAAAGADSVAASANPIASRPTTDKPAPSGNLGVIIVRQSSTEGGLEGSEALTGQPVYTVYLEVPGSPRRWVLQYCVPGAEARGFVQPSESRIQILPRRSVQPPFPLEKIPVDVTGAPGGARRLVVYALVNERGEIQNVRLVRGVGLPVDETAVATLQRWSFRPATRGEAPVTVEALFGIPID